MDEYDQMMKDLLPHHALEPATFIERSNALEGTPFTYNLDITKSNVSITGERATSLRPGQIRNLIQGVKQHLPDDFALKMTGSDHDTGSVVLGQDQREKAMEYVKLGKRTFLVLPS